MNFKFCETALFETLIYTAATFLLVTCYSESVHNKYPSTCSQFSYSCQGGEASKTAENNIYVITPQTVTFQWDQNKKKDTITTGKSTVKQYFSHCVEASPGCCQIRVLAKVSGLSYIPICIITLGLTSSTLPAWRCSKRT